MTMRDTDLSRCLALTCIYFLPPRSCSHARKLRYVQLGARGAAADPRNLGEDVARETVGQERLGGRSSDSSSESNGRVNEVEVIRYPHPASLTHTWPPLLSTYRPTHEREAEALKRSSKILLEPRTLAASLRRHVIHHTNADTRYNVTHRHCSRFIDVSFHPWPMDHTKQDNNDSSDQALSIRQGAFMQTRQAGETVGQSDDKESRQGVLAVRQRSG